MRFPELVAIAPERRPEPRTGRGYRRARQRLRTWKERNVSSETKTILVTGATGGIGRAVCAQLAAGGHSLVLAARDSSKLASLQASLSAVSAQACRWISVDMGNDGSVEQLAAELNGAGVHLDGAVLMPPQPHATSDSL